MSDDLSPAGQARAARWAADWIARNTLCGYSPDEVNQCLLAHASRIDPPETVESLRAEQDKVVAQFEMVLLERNKARKDVEYWREQFKLACDESEDRKKQADEARARHATVSQERDALRDVLAAVAAHAEAARERAKRQPRVWKDGDPEPVGVTVVRDTARQWNCTWRKVSDDAWRCDDHGVHYSWRSVATRGVTE